MGRHGAFAVPADAVAFGLRCGPGPAEPCRLDLGPEPILDRATHPILPAASAPRRMVSDDAMTYRPMLDRSECPSASAAAARSPVAARKRVAYRARSLWAVKSTP